MASKPALLTWTGCRVKPVTAVSRAPERLVCILGCVRYRSYPRIRSLRSMGASSLILALSALWTGPSWGQDRSGVGPIGPVRVSTLTLLCTAPGSRRADVKVAASVRSRSGDVERYQLTGNRRLLYSTYTQTTGCADNKELRWNAPSDRKTTKTRGRDPNTESKALR